MKLLYTVGYLIIFTTGVSYASESDIISKYKELEEQIKTLEQKVAEQDKCLEKQRLCIEEQHKRLSEYMSRLEGLDKKLHRQVGITAFEEEGFKISAGTTMIVQGTNSPNTTESKKKDRADASYSADIAITKDFEAVDSKAFVHLEAGTGAGIEDELSLYSNVNRDADNDNNVRVTELWYEQGLFEDKVALTFGKLDPTIYFDTNEVANDETTQFLGRIFRNSPTIEVPDNSAGVRLTLTPCLWLEINWGIFDSDWEEIGNNLFGISEVKVKPNVLGLTGNYRFLGWINDSYHTKWLDTAREKEGTFGFGLSFDQNINSATTVFLRYGWQYPKVYNTAITASGGFNYSLEHSWSSGFQLNGKMWTREKDIFGFAIGQAMPSDDYKKADLSRKAKDEGHLEGYYNIYINNHLSITPDFQYIWNPFGRDIDDDISAINIYGLRAQLDF